ncbi:MAG: hypothetical protein QG657_5069 [Acidobacteriota bacterium]|nr:hypothetical protein [Acidobacteriota bacterium]
MEPFWKNEKYQSTGIASKESILDGYERNWKMLTKQHIKSLPSYSALKRVFKDMNKLTDHNLADKKAIFIALIKGKTEKRRKQHWQHQDFAEKLTRRIREIDDATKLKEWLACFLEYYRLLKSENKDD